DEEQREAVVRGAQRRAGERRRDARRIRGEGDGTDACRRLLDSVAQRRQLDAAERGEDVGVGIAEAELSKELTIERDPRTRREHVERWAVERSAGGVHPPSQPEEVEGDADAVELDGEAALVAERDQATVEADLEREEHAGLGVDDGAVLALGK